MATYYITIPTSVTLPTDGNKVSLTTACEIHRDDSATPNALTVAEDTYNVFAAEDYGTASSDTTAPTVSTAVTDAAGDTITITMTETVTGTEAVGDWAVNDVTGGSATIDSVTISGDTITLELSGNLVQSGDAPTVDYTAGDIEDSAGNPLASFADQSVTNNVSSFDPADLFTSGTREGWWFDFDDLSNIYQDTGRSTLVSAADQNLYSATDKSGNGWHITYSGVGGGSNSFYRESVGGQGYLELAIGTNIAGFTSATNTVGADITNLTIFVGLKTSDTNFALLPTDNNGDFAGVAEDGDTANATEQDAGSPTYHVDGGSALTTPNRDDLHTNWSTGAWVVAEIQDFTLLIGREHALGRYGGAVGACLAGDITCVICVENVTSQERSDIVSYIQGKEF